MNEIQLSNSEVVVLNHGSLTKSIENVKSDLPEYWERDYIKEHLEQIENKKHKAFFEFMWYTGCRVSEALLVRKRDIDLKNFIVTIRWQKSRKYRYRNIPMYPLLKNSLDYYMDHYNAEDLLFPFSRQRAFQLCQKYFNGNPHRLRHSFAVNWLRSGQDIYGLSRMLGHSDIKTTTIYLNLVPQDIGKMLIKIVF